MDTIQEKIRMSRLSKRLSQKEVADLIGLSLSTYRRIEAEPNQYENLKLKNLKALNKVLEIDIEELIKG